MGSVVETSLLAQPIFKPFFFIYVKTRPEWNGKDLVTRGGSLGGIENLCAAALDKDITIAIISVPSACDYNAQASGRKPQGVYRRPEYSKLLLENPALAKSMSYHDGVNFAKRVTCETYVCCPEGRYTARY